MAEPTEVMPDEISTEVEETSTDEGLDTKADEGDEVEIEVESKPKDSDLAAEKKELERQLYELGKEVQELKKTKTAPVEVKETRKVEGEEGDLTPAQIVALMKEHSDNPEVLYRVIDHVSEQKAKKIAASIRDETVQDINYKQWYSEHKKTNDGLMADYYKAMDPQLRDSIKSTVKNLALDNHPLSELMVFGLLKLAQEAKSSETAEATRTSNIKNQKGLDKTRSEGSKSAGAKLSTEQIAIAKKLGVDVKTYSKFVGSDTAASEKQ